MVIKIYFKSICKSLTLASTVTMSGNNLLESASTGTINILSLSQALKLKANDSADKVDLESGGVMSMRPTEATTPTGPEEKSNTECVIGKPQRFDCAASNLTTDNDSAVGAAADLETGNVLIHPECTNANGVAEPKSPSSNETSDTDDAAQAECNDKDIAEELVDTSLNSSTNSRHAESDTDSDRHNESSCDSAVIYAGSNEEASESTETQLPQEDSPTQSVSKADSTGISEHNDSDNISLFNRLRTTNYLSSCPRRYKKPAVLICGGATLLAGTAGGIAGYRGLTNSSGSNSDSSPPNQFPVGKMPFDDSETMDNKNGSNSGPTSDDYKNYFNVGHYIEDAMTHPDLRSSGTPEMHDSYDSLFEAPEEYLTKVKEDMVIKYKGVSGYKVGFDSLNATESDDPDARNFDVSIPYLDPNDDPVVNNGCEFYGCYLKAFNNLREEMRKEMVDQNKQNSKPAPYESMEEFKTSDKELWSVTLNDKERFQKIKDFASETGVKFENKEVKTYWKRIYAMITGIHLNAQIAMSQEERNKVIKENLLKSEENSVSTTTMSNSDAIKNLAEEQLKILLLPYILPLPEVSKVLFAKRGGIGIYSSKTVGVAGYFKAPSLFAIGKSTGTFFNSEFLSDNKISNHLLVHHELGHVVLEKVDMKSTWKNKKMQDNNIAVTDYSENLLEDAAESFALISIISYQKYYEQNPNLQDKLEKPVKLKQIEIDYLETVYKHRFAYIREHYGKYLIPDRVRFRINNDTNKTTTTASNSTTSKSGLSGGVRRLLSPLLNLLGRNKLQFELKPLGNTNMDTSNFKLDDKDRSEDFKQMIEGLGKFKEERRRLQAEIRRLRQEDEERSGPKNTGFLAKKNTV